MSIEQVDRGPWNGHSIPTSYSGTTFRSRTEARWAVFLDQLGVRWFYEYEGFVSPDGVHYLPDFWLPAQRCFLEIKPPSWEILGENSKFCALQQDNQKLIVLAGVPGECMPGWDPYCGSELVGGTMVSPGWDGPYCFCFCPICDQVGIEYMGLGDRVCHGTECASALHKSYTGDDIRIGAAAEIARLRSFY